MKPVLVAGATGYLGRHVVRELSNQGYQVRALIRQYTRLKDIRPFINEPVLGEITKAETLRGICNGIDVVFTSVGITRQRDGLTYMDVDYQGNLNLLREAVHAGVSKFIYVSVYQAHEMKTIRNVQAKLAFERALRESGLNYTILYPTAFFSDMQEYLEMAWKGKGYILGSGENRINPIHGADLARVCAEAISSREREVHVGGPDVLTHNQTMQLAFGAVKKQARITHVPQWVTACSVQLLRMFTSVKTYGPVEFLSAALSRDMVAPSSGDHHLADFFQKQANTHPTGATK